MSEQIIIELLREACDYAQKKDMRSYHRLMDEAKLKIERCANNTLRGEYLMAATFDCGRSWGELLSIYREVILLTDGRSELFPRGCHLFADYYNVFAICNVEAGHADENADKLSAISSLFYKLTGGGLGTDICYRAQLLYYRGELDEALPLAKKAFDTAKQNDQGLIALCAAELLIGIAKHKQDVELWRVYAEYIDSVARKNDEASRACREQAQLQRYMQDLSLGFLHTVPDWIKNGDFGIVSAPWGWEHTDDKLLAGSVPNALLVRLECASYSGDTERALLIADIMQKVYCMSDVILDAYLGFFRAGCYLQLNDTERARETLECAIKLLAPDGLWLIAAEFAPAFGKLLYDAAEETDQNGARRIREIGADYWDKLAPFREDILRSATLGLTKREKEISGLLLSGKTNAEIAEQLGISERTVKGHVTGIFRKYNIFRRNQLAHAMHEKKEAQLANWTQ